MADYLRLIGEFFPNTGAYVSLGNDPTIYSNIVWIDTPIDQATLDALSTGEETLESRVDARLAELTPGDILQWDGSNFVPIPEPGGGGGDDLTGKLFTIEFGTQSSIGGDWLHLDGNPSNETPHIMPWACKLVAITFTNKESSADTELQVNRVDEGQGNSPSPTVFSWIIDNARVARKTDFSPDVTFAKGDKIAIFAKQRGGTDPSQVKVMLYLTVTAADESNNIENYSGDIS